MTRDEIKAAILDYVRAATDLRRLWERIPAEMRIGLYPPPGWTEAAAAAAKDGGR